MRFSKTVSAAALAAAVGVAAGGCGGSYDGSGTSAGTPATGGSGGGSTLRVNMAVAPGTLDPASGCGSNDLALIGNLYTRLTQYGSKPGPDGTQQFDPGNIEPYAAKSWKVTNGGRTYTFRMRPGAKFPSGKPVDSHAVKYSFERALTMNGCGGYFLEDGLLAPPLIKSIETPNAQTVVFKLSQADPNALQAWAQPAAAIVDKSVVDQHGGVKKNGVNQWMSSHAAGAGPFLLQSYEPNKSAVLAANPGYAAGDPPASKKLTIDFVNSDPTLLLQAKSGNADVTLGLSKQSAKSLAGNGNVRLIVNETPLSEQIGMPNTKPPFDNATFRRGLALALPYQQILDKAAFGYGTLFSGPLQPVFPEYNAKLEQPYRYDPAKAKQLVQQSGVKTPVTVQMAIQEGNTADEQIATIAQGEWRKLGVNVKLLKLPASQYISGLQAHKYQSYVRLDGPGVIDPGYYLGYDMKCHLPVNLSEICIPKADKLLDEARRTTDETRRRALYDQITRLWQAEVPKIQVYADKNVTVLGKGVKSYLYSHETDFRTWAK